MDFDDPAVEEVFKRFDDSSRETLLELRGLVFEVASDAYDIGAVTETLKWGQPSYLAQKGSTVRLGEWKAAGEVAVYFNCQTSLIEVFKEVFGSELRFEGKRAILLTEIRHETIKQCLYLALTYHSKKHLPLLGM